MLPVVAIVGRPNVGKSTIFNRMVGSRISIVDDYSGVTRDRIYAKANWLNRDFNVIDTGGIEISDASFQTQIKAQVEIAIKEADVIVFVCDITSSVFEDDIQIAKMIFKANKPVIVAVNKADDQRYSDFIYDFYSLGIQDVIPVSGIHGIGMGDLLDKVISYFKDGEDDEYSDEYIKLCVIGRPNVGKSSLTNSLLKEERVIVSDIEGTTTDSIDTPFEHDGQKYVVIDTAGIRKSGKIYEKIEKYSVLRAMTAIERSDICLIVIDAITGILEQDKHIAGYAVDANKCIIIVVNKWDAIEKTEYTMNEWEDNIRKEFKFLSYVPIVFLSALTNKRVNTLFPIIETIYANYNRRVSTSVLNDVIVDAMLLNPPKLVNNVKLRVFYATEVAVKPPTIVFFVNDINAMHFSYERYLDNRIRENFDFYGTPIKKILRKRD